MTLIKVGSIEVYPIQDVTSNMSVELFSGPLSRAERDELMPDGLAESSGNVFLIRSAGKIALVDSGWGLAFGMVGKARETMLEMGLSPADVDMVLMTHLHFDHTMGLLEEDDSAAYPRAAVYVSRAEMGFLSAPGALEGEKTRIGAELLLRIRAAYGERLRIFDFGAEILPGVTAMDASGHTAGHTAYLVESAGEKLLVAGDFIHAAALQFRHPDECPAYDAYPEQAAHTRRAICELAATTNLPVGGMHLPFPGVGKISRAGDGYSFTLLEP